MRMIFFLRTLCSFLFYFAWASFILPTPFDTPIVDFGVFFICLTSAYLCFCLSERKFLRFLPLALLALLYFSIGNVMELFIVMPAAIYVVYLAIKNENSINHTEFQYRFKLGGWALVFLLVISMIMSIFVNLTSVFVLCLAYFICGIMLLRALRHHADTFSDPGFILYNIIPGFVFAFGVLLLSSGVIVSVASAFLFVMRMGFYYLFIVPLNFLLGLTEPLYLMARPERPADTQGNPIREPVSAAEMLEDIEPGELDPFLARILLIALAVIASILLIILVVYLIRKIMARWKLPSWGTENDVSIIESTIMKTGSSIFPKFKRLPLVRRYYRRFLRLCAMQNINLKQADTSLEIEGIVQTRFGNKAELKQLRSLYLRARYGNEDISKDDELLAKKAYKGIKEHMKNN